MKPQNRQPHRNHLGHLTDINPPLNQIPPPSQHLTSLFSTPPTCTCDSPFDLTTSPTFLSTQTPVPASPRHKSSSHPRRLQRQSLPASTLTLMQCAQSSNPLYRDKVLSRDCATTSNSALLLSIVCSSAWVSRVFDIDCLLICVGIQSLRYRVFHALNKQPWQGCLQG